MMNNNYWRETVYAVSPLDGLERRDMSAIFNWLNLHFPSCGTKIDWGRVQGRHMHWKITDDMRLAATASIEVCRRIQSGSVVEHVGDGLSPYGVCFTDDNAPSVVAALLEIPEHHYFLAEDRSWIVVVTTEGDLEVVDQL
ncbi:hypothetical protein GCM10012289_75740 [Nonomuraea cavernae]|uniref:Uncharacterized protein n=1 Tax=Nonomuraea cavernae TaxID=2045107 RepID=A0A917ZIC3_9ACTN|nr:hypothetical protein GCM10012289_75740 [Nonomuraea cavernae]